jgi:hypothetical protein
LLIDPDDEQLDKDRQNESGQRIQDEHGAHIHGINPGIGLQRRNNAERHPNQNLQDERPEAQFC